MGAGSCVREREAAAAGAVSAAVRCVRVSK